MSPELRRALAGEAAGTFLLVVVGTGTVASSVLLGKPSSLPAVAAIWGLAVAAAILLAAPLSGAHLNPAVSLALAAWRPASVPRGQLLPRLAAQLAGATAAGAVVLLVFGGPLAEFEAREWIVRGQPGSERAAMIFGEYFPNPAMHGTGPAAAALVGPWTALLHEALGTAALVLVVFAVSDPASRVPARLVPLLVGAALAGIIVLVAPSTQSGLNPARDFGPRCVAWAAGFGPIAIPGPRAGFLVYLAGPILGALAAGGLWERGLRRLVARDRAISE
jgi:glycerol uptake facilitator protein